MSVEEIARSDGIRENEEVLKEAIQKREYVMELPTGRTKPRVWNDEGPGTRRRLLPSTCPGFGKCPAWSKIRGTFVQNVLGVLALSTSSYKRAPVSGLEM